MPKIKPSKHFMAVMAILADEEALDALPDLPNEFTSDSHAEMTREHAADRSRPSSADFLVAMEDLATLAECDGPSEFDRLADRLLPGIVHALNRPIGAHPRWLKEFGV